jgi:hypothetical protein
VLLDANYAPILRKHLKEENLCSDERSMKSSLWKCMDIKDDEDVAGVDYLGDYENGCEEGDEKVGTMKTFSTRRPLIATLQVPINPPKIAPPPNRISHPGTSVRGECRDGK